jgi:hypothetical protein
MAENTARATDWTYVAASAMAADVFVLMPVEFNPGYVNMRITEAWLMIVICLLRS